MTDQMGQQTRLRRQERGSPQRVSRQGHGRATKVGLPLVVLGTVLVCASAWLGLKVQSIRTELEAASRLVPELKQQILASDAVSAAGTVEKLRLHTSQAREEAEDPLWTLAAGLPWIGVNFSAVSEMTRSADDVAALGLKPLVNVYESLNWDVLLPTSSGSNLEPIRSAAPTVVSAAHAVRASSERLQGIDRRQLLPQVANPLQTATNELREVTGALNSAADAATVAPEMLGANGAKHYLLMIQNNAEARATGGIPGALAILRVDQGKLALGAQSSAATLGVMAPVLPTDTQQQQIYSTRLGKYMQDVNLTPDFPTAAATAQGMWERRMDQRVDGVISIDPVVLSYILEATGPVAMTGPELTAAEAAGLPTELSASNVVATLLSDVYAKIAQPNLQDAYFAGVAREVFTALSNGQGNANTLITGISRGAEEGRVLIWSASANEQDVLAKYSFGGSITGPSISPAQFGVYFNDGTGAKMDYYVKRTVQLVRECPADGYETTTVRVTSTNTAPADSATSLPAYVTGGGAFGVPPGSVQTNVVTYGPVQATVEFAKADGQRTAFAPYQHATRPVGVVAQRLAPGETKTLEFTFGKIVQHTEPALAVTPSVQSVKDVILPTINAQCEQSTQAAGKY
ncbi:DUF4012 domain-containing protein [Arthrobacter nitrophenolicus]|uniref:DUF4012 domain-containing protein n=2 Tax=Arthrobacter nitrophenolicus TaxID=683150 RepID=A0A4R5Y1Q5_9MICC|nr:DUF4012 domain-containing protein [Arthrobacter nitrophenolicus]